MTEEKLLMCRQHLQLYSHYCKAPGCRKLLCIKCLGPHKLFHQSGISMVTCLSIYNTFLDDMQICHDRLNDLLSIVTKLGEEFKLCESQLNSNVEIIENYMVDIHNYAKNKQNSKIGDRYAKFLRIKAKESKSAMTLISKIIFKTKSAEAFKSLYKEMPFELFNFEKATQQFYFINPLSNDQKTLQITSVFTSTLSPNAQAFLYNNSIFLVNGSHREFFESVIPDVNNPHESVRFAPRANLIKKIKFTNYSTIGLYATYLYIICEEGLNQKYAIYSDKWLPVPPLRVKSQNVNVCLISERYLYAFRGKANGISIEILDVLDEESGWHLVLPKLKGKIKMPLVDSSIVFQQNNVDIIILGNTSSYMVKASNNEKSSSTTTLCYNMIDKQLGYWDVAVPEIKINKTYNLCDKRQIVRFVEEDYDSRIVWKFSKLEKQFKSIYSYQI